MYLLLQLGHEARHLVLKDLQLRGSRLFHLRIESRHANGIVKRNVLAFADVDLYTCRFITSSFLANAFRRTPR